MTENMEKLHIGRKPAQITLDFIKCLDDFKMGNLVEITFEAPFEKHGMLRNSSLFIRWKAKNEHMNITTVSKSDGLHIRRR